MAKNEKKLTGTGKLPWFKPVFEMKIALLGKLRNRLGNKGNYVMRIVKKVPRALDVSRSLVVAVGFLLGLLLMGGPAEVSTQETNADGDLRLVDITTGEVVSLIITPAPSGRLEIFDDEDGDSTGEWKGICDDNLGVLGTEEENNIRVIGRQEAEVACRQLGFSGGTPLTELAVPADAAGDGEVPLEYYLLDDLECSGSEARIFGEGKCKHLARGESNCGANEAFGVTCEPATSNNDAVGQIAIRGTETKTGVTVTADHSGITDEDGKPADESSFTYQWISVDVAYNETEISAATNFTYTFQSADEENWVKVRISFTDEDGNSEEVASFEVGPIYPDLPDGSLRLIPTTDMGTGETSDFNSGLLEIFDNETKQWKGVCDDGWGTEEAEVACKQLGLSGGTGETNVIRIGLPPLLFLLDDVDCDGTENTLFECEHAGFGVSNCTSWEYAGVSCEAASGSDSQ